LKLVLFDDSTKASERLRNLAVYEPEHIRTIHELVGLAPHLILVDEAVTPEAVKEVMDWGLAVCIFAQRVTVALRRKFPMVKDVVTDAKVLSYLEERFTPESEQSTPVEDPVSIRTNSATAIPVSPTQAIVTPALSDQRPIAGRGGQVLGFVSLRSHGGGAGKTGVVFNYAAYAVKHGRKVLVIDLDPNGPFGVLAVAHQDLTTEHWCNLMKQHQGATMTERAVLDNVERQEPYGFYMITSPSREDMIKKHELRWILEQTRPYFDLVFFDMPATWTGTTIEMMHMADEVLLFGQYDPIQYVEYKRSIPKVTNPLIGAMTKERLHVVLGRAYLGKNRDVELDEVKRQLGVENAMLIPEDPLFQQFRNAHKAIVLEKPSAECAKALLPWLKARMADERFNSNLPALYEPRGKIGLFQRLFRGIPKSSKPSKKAVSHG